MSLAVWRGRGKPVPLRCGCRWTSPGAAWCRLVPGRIIFAPYLPAHARTHGAGAAASRATAEQSGAGCNCATAWSGGVGGVAGVAPRCDAPQRDARPAAAICIMQKWQRASDPETEWRRRPRGLAAPSRYVLTTRRCNVSNLINCENSKYFMA